jgi:transposase-like protein
MFDMAQRERRTYSPEQKADAVRLVRQTGSVSKVAKDLDLTETSLRNWLKQAEVDEGLEAIIVAFGLCDERTELAPERGLVCIELGEERLARVP